MQLRHCFLVMLQSMIISAGCGRDPIVHRLTTSAGDARGRVAGDGGQPDVTEPSGWRRIDTREYRNLYAVWGSDAAKIVVAVGDDGAIVTLDSNDRVAIQYAASGVHLRGVWGDINATGWATAWAVGGSQIYTAQLSQPATTAWEPESAFIKANGLTAIFGMSAQRRWLVGAQGAIFETSGTPPQWQQIHFSGEDLTDIWGSSDSDMWVIGLRGTVLHMQSGGSWQPQIATTNPLAADLNGIWGASAADIWIVGEDGVLLHWDGSRFEQLPSGTTEDLHGIWGRSQTDIWAVGSRGTVLHYDGTAWTVVDSVGGTIISRDLFGVWGDKTGRVYVVGAQGTVLTYTP